MPKVKDTQITFDDPTIKLLSSVREFVGILLFELRSHITMLFIFIFTPYFSNFVYVNVLNTGLSSRFNWNFPVFADFAHDTQHTGYSAQAIWLAEMWLLSTLQTLRNMSWTACIISYLFFSNRQCLDLGMNFDLQFKHHYFCSLFKMFDPST